MESVVLPICCDDLAFRGLQQTIKTLDTDATSCLVGAWHISRHWHQRCVIEDVVVPIQEYADAVKSKARSGTIDSILAHLNDTLYEEAGFAPGTNDEPNLNMLPSVLRTKYASPVIMSLIYIEVARRCGLPCHGINFPGRFFVGVGAHDEMFIDAFACGRLVTLGEMQALAQGWFGMMEWSNNYLAPATPRLTLTRILQNLLVSYGNRRNDASVAACLEMEMLLWPREEKLKRDLGLILAKMGMSAPAKALINSYIVAVPEDPQREELRHLVKKLAA